MIHTIVILMKVDADTFSGELDIDTLIALEYLEKPIIKGSPCTGYVRIEENIVKAFLECGEKYVSDSGGYPINFKYGSNF